eukprot:SAG31_NODE_9032_length_1345_cov_1.495185_1_plen_119_part_10
MHNRLEMRTERVHSTRLGDFRVGENRSSVGCPTFRILKRISSLSYEGKRQEHADTILPAKEVVKDLQVVTTIVNCTQNMQTYRWKAAPCLVVVHDLEVCSDVIDPSTKSWTAISVAPLI